MVKIVKNTEGAINEVKGLSRKKKSPSNTVERLYKTI
jgi:hypothetical protein